MHASNLHLVEELIAPDFKMMLLVLTLNKDEISSCVIFLVVEKITSWHPLVRLIAAPFRFPCE